MTNEITTGVVNIVDSAAGAVKQLTTTIDQWPLSVLIVFVLVVVIIVLRSVERFPNNRILLTTVVLGAAMNGLLGSRATVPADQAYPAVVLGFKGSVLGFAAAAFYSIVLKRFEGKFKILRGKLNGDTMEFYKPKHEQKESNEPDP